MEFSHNPLWQFSLDFYDRPGVAEACLSLQDKSGADVNVVLFLLWCAATERPLDAERIAEADRLISAWRQAVIKPLRAVRRAMKTSLLPGIETEALRHDVKSAELSAERLAQQVLFALALPPKIGSEKIATARYALGIYSRQCRHPFAADSNGALIDNLSAVIAH